MWGERETKLPRWWLSCSPLALCDGPVSARFKLLMSQSRGLTESLAVSSAHPNPFMWLLYRLPGATEAGSLFFHTEKIHELVSHLFFFQTGGFAVIKI